jgi:hypothetical protein
VPFADITAGRQNVFDMLLAAWALALTNPSAVASVLHRCWATRFPRTIHPSSIQIRNI